MKKILNILSVVSIALMFLIIIYCIYVLNFKDYSNNTYMFGGLEKLGDIFACALSIIVILVILLIFRIIINALKFKKSEAANTKVKYKRNIISYSIVIGIIVIAIAYYPVVSFFDRSTIVCVEPTNEELVQLVKNEKKLNIDVIDRFNEQDSRSEWGFYYYHVRIIGSEDQAQLTVKKYYKENDFFKTKSDIVFNLFELDYRDD